MTSFIAAAPAAPEATLPHHPFWPEISPGDFRAVMNVDGAVTPARLRFALIEAVALVNSELARFRMASGASSLAEIPDEEPGRLEHLYRRAVFERAKGDLMERYNTIAATGDGQQRAEAQEAAINDHYRNSLWAIRDILGQRRTTVELI
jgi:hypothetical protein